MTEWLAVAGWAALHLTWQGWVVWLAFAAVRAALADATPPARHAVAVAALGAIVAAPAATVFLMRRAVAAPATVLLDQAAVSGGWWPSALAALGAGWAAGTVLALAHLVRAVLRLHALELRPLPALEPLVGSLSREMSLPCIPRVVTAPDVAAPFVMGISSPVLVLPADIDGLLPEAELRALLRHELAHVRRRDFAANLLLRALLCLVWPQPAARLIAAAAATERERCCDEEAVAAHRSAISLARALVALESRRAAAPAVSLAGTGGPLVVRVRSLTIERPRRRLRHTAVAAGALPTFAVVLWGAAALPAGSKPAERVALLVDPLVTVAATDPAGEFTLQLVGGRARALVIGSESVPPTRLRQDGRRVRALDPSGRTALSLMVRADGAGISWSPRSTSPP